MQEFVRHLPALVVHPAIGPNRVVDHGFPGTGIDPYLNRLSGQEISFALRPGQADTFPLGRYRFRLFGFPHLCGLNR